MKTILTARLSWIAPLAVLIGTSGCASHRNELGALKSPAIPQEASVLPDGIVKTPSEPARSSKIVQTGGQQDDQPRAGKRNGNGAARDAVGQNLEKRIEIPKELPGAEVPRLHLPPKHENEKEYEAAIRKLFPSLSDPSLAPAALAFPLALKGNLPTFIS